MTPRDLRRVQVVARHYSTFRGGVTRAIWIPAILLVGLFELVIPSRGAIGAALGLLRILIGAGVAIVVWMHARRWMDRRFGRVRSRRDVLIGLGSTAAVWFFLAGNSVDERYATTADLPSVTFLGSAAFGAWLVISLGRYGLHNLLPTVASVVAALALMGVHDEVSFDGWQIRAFFVTGSAWIFAGMIDFVLLWKALGRNPAAVRASATGPDDHAHTV